MLRFEAIATDISTKFWPGISGKTVCPFLLSLSFLSVLIIATHHCNCSADTSMQIFFKQILYCPIFFNHAACINLSVYRVVSCRVVSCRVVSCRVVSCRVVSCRIVSCRVVSCRNRVVSVSRYTRTCSNNRCRLKYPLSLSLSLPLSLSLSRSLARSSKSFSNRRIEFFFFPYFGRLETFHSFDNGSSFRTRVSSIFSLPYIYIYIERQNLERRNKCEKKKEKRERGKERKREREKEK